MISAPGRALAHLRRRLRAMQTLLRPGLAMMLLACSLLLAPPAMAGEPAADVVSRQFPDIDFADLRDALVEAIAEEGIATPVVSHFGDMLARTAGDLGHRPDLYAHAEIFTFCSAALAARLASEARGHIALCPLSIAVYALPDAPRTVFIAYRPPAVDSAGGEAARSLMAQIVARAARLVGRP